MTMTAPSRARTSRIEVASSTKAVDSRDEPESGSERSAHGMLLLLLRQLMLSPRQDARAGERRLI